MARQTGIIRLSGSLDGITFFENKNGHYARRKSSLDKQRFLNDPQFERTRENSNEFQMASRGYSLLRHAFLPDIRLYSGQEYRKQFIGLMMQLKALDTIHVRGQRTAAEGLRHPDGTGLFRDLQFNNKQTLSGLLFCRKEADTSTGSVRLTDFVPDAHLNYPTPATHVQLTAFRAHLDLERHAYLTVKASTQILTIDGTVHDIVLQPEGPWLSSGLQLLVLQVRFFQELNGGVYPLKQENSGAMGVVAASCET